MFPRTLARLLGGAALVLLGAGCRTVDGVHLQPVDGHRQFVLRNDTGQDLSGTRFRGHLVWAGELFAIEPATIGSWPSGAELRTINLHYPISALVLHGFSDAGRFEVSWQESDRVLFHGRTVGRTALQSVVDDTRTELKLFAP